MTIIILSDEAMNLFMSLVVDRSPGVGMAKLSAMAESQFSNPIKKVSCADRYSNSKFSMRKEMGVVSGPTLSLAIVSMVLLSSMLPVTVVTKMLSTSSPNAVTSSSRVSFLENDTIFESSLVSSRSPDFMFSYIVAMTAPATSADGAPKFMHQSYELEMSSDESQSPKAPPRSLLQALNAAPRQDRGDSDSSVVVVDDDNSPRRGAVAMPPIGDEVDRA